jgi:hypothetical protein
MERFLSQRQLTIGLLGLRRTACSVNGYLAQPKIGSVTAANIKRLDIRE